MEYNKAKQLDNLYKQLLIRDNFDKFLHEENKINFYRRQTYYENCALIEYNINTSAEPLQKGDDIVRYSFEKKRI